MQDDPRPDTKRDTQRWDPEMLAASRATEAAASALPPVRLDRPIAPQRPVNDAPALLAAEGGPAMAETTERWVAARGRRVLCRMHRPRTDRVLPALVYFHGGGWVFASVDTHDRLAREYAAAAGIAVVLVDYALSPEARFPQAVEECAEVVRWLARSGDVWGIDGARLVVGGDSAGGNLALATALLLRDTDGPALSGVLVLYPVCDADFSTPSYREFGDGRFGLSEERMRAFWGLYLREEADRLHPLAAPLRARLAGLPPVLVQLAELDVLRSEGEDLVARLRAAGVEVGCEVYAGVTHGFARALASVAKARAARDAAAGWVRGRLAG